MDIYKITSIGRPLDPKFKTNRVIGVATLAVLAASFIYQLIVGIAWVDAALWALGATLTVFLTWALGREIDPDHDASAFIAAGLTIPGFLIFDLPDFFSLFWFLMASRIVNRTTGLPAKAQDSIIVFLLGGWLMFQGNWGFGVASIILFVTDSKLEPKNRKQWIFAALSAIATASLLNQVTWIHPFQWSNKLWMIAIISVLFIPFIHANRKITSKGDANDEPLEPVRVQSVQTLVLLLALQITIWNSTNGFENIMPLWAVFGGTSLFYFWNKTIKRNMS